MDALSPVNQWSTVDRPRFDAGRQFILSTLKTGLIRAFTPVVRQHNRVPDPHPAGTEVCRSNPRAC